MSIDHRRSAARRCSVWVPLLLSAASVACGEDPAIDVFGSQSQPIINGTATSNWPAAGALVGDIGNGHWAEYCSATLIASQWILTAAHCIDPQDSNIPPVNVAHFSVGANVDSGATRYVIDVVTPHPDYSRSAVTDDIGMAHVSLAVSGVTPIPNNTANLGSGNTITWVGYGVNVATGGGDGTGNGIKRTANGKISSLSPYTYSYNQNSAGQLTCFGDSGGPDLVGASGSEKVSGVHSTVGDDYCTSNGTSTRVDAYAMWIANVMTGTTVPTDCDITGGDCGSQACAEIDTNVFRCLPSDGKSVGASCNSDPSTWANLPCKDGAYCINYVDGSVCYQFCRSSGDCTGGKKCAFVFTDEPTLGVCLASTCNITGGDCTTGACYPVAPGINRCHTSSGAALGTTCNPATSSSSPVPCDDGLLCLKTGTAATDGTCLPFCITPSDCDTNSTCKGPVFQGISDIGVCVASSTCACDTGTACQTSCACDPDCQGPGCTCNTGTGCQANCACDPDCQSGSCACDTDYYCDTTCYCDAECPCACDTTYSCDTNADGSDCTCDIECKSSGGCGCSFDQGARGILVAPSAAFLLLLSRRRRSTRTGR